MKHTIKYELQVSFSALEKTLDGIPEYKGKLWIHVPWVDRAQPCDDDDEALASITFPNPKQPELTRALFFRVMCAALPVSRHNDTGFFVTAFADTERDGKSITAVHFQDSYQPEWERQKPGGYNGTFWVREEIFAADAREKLGRIERICMEGPGQ